MDRRIDEIDQVKLKDSVANKTNQKGDSKNSSKSNGQGQTKDSARHIKKNLEDAVDKVKGKFKALAKLSEIVEEDKVEVLSDKSKSCDKQPSSESRSEPDKQVGQDLSPRDDLDNV